MPPCRARAEHHAVRAPRGVLAREAWPHGPQGPGLRESKPMVMQNGRVPAGYPIASTLKTTGLSPSVQQVMAVPTFPIQG
jgi:hypothetical protein